MKNEFRTTTLAVLATFCLLWPSAAFADACDRQTAEQLAQQRNQYIDGIVSLAEQNFSRRLNSFAKLTCLDRIMKQSSVDLFFSPPSLDDLFSKIENLVCERANEIFDQIHSVKLDFGVDSLTP